MFQVIKCFEFTLMQNFVAAVSLLWVLVLMALNCSWFVFDFTEVSVLLVTLVVFAMVLSQN